MLFSFLASSCLHLSVYAYDYLNPHVCLYIYLCFYPFYRPYQRMYVCLCVCVHIATHTMIAICDLQKSFLREAKVPYTGCGPLHLILPVHDSAVTRSSSGGRDGRKVCHRASSQPFLDGQKNSSRKRGCGRTSRRMRLAWIVEELF